MRWDVKSGYKDKKFELMALILSLSIIDDSHSSNSLLLFVTWY